MTLPTLTAIKLETAHLADCERFFTQVFGFGVTHRYGGGPDDGFAETVMTLGGADPTMLKFVQQREGGFDAIGATIQIVLAAIEPAIEAATAAGATLAMPVTAFPEASVRMAVVTTPQGLGIELVQRL